MNVLVIVIDALRSDIFGHTDLIPNITGMVESGVFLENACSCTNATDSSVTSLLSGRHPLSHGIVEQGPQISAPEAVRRLNRNGVLLLSQILGSRGFATHAIDWLGRWHKRGYDHYSGTGEVFAAEKEGALALRLGRKLPGRMRTVARGVMPSQIGARRKGLKITEDAEYVSANARRIMKEEKGDLLLFLHFWDTHAPYQVPGRFVEAGTCEELGLRSQRIVEIPEPLRSGFMSQEKTTGEIADRYLGAVRYVDHEIGSILSGMEEASVLDDTLVVLTSDHGESLAEHGIYFDHHGLYDVSIRVPVVMRGPGLPEGRRLEGLFQHTDIVPTILDLLGIEVRLLFDGKSILPFLDEPGHGPRSEIVAQEAWLQHKRCLRTGEYKYIESNSKDGAVCRKCGIVHGGETELYDLRKDPGELVNLVDERAELAGELRSRISQWETAVKTRREQQRIKFRARRLDGIPGRTGEA